MSESSSAHGAPSISVHTPFSGLNSRDDAVLELGRRVLLQESSALQRLAEGLDAGFSRCVDAIFHCTGRVAVTGMGKSGHVARKIAATLSSTGTPAYFIHPGEASHGDLGTVLANDALLALSNSGESPELTDILEYTARRGIPIIAMTRNPDSFLGRQADLLLLLPDVGEACPLGCAPTSSTTMMMAMGDALAMALLKLHGFTAADFSRFHPGGHLGRRLRLVRDIMHCGDQIPLADAATPMSEALVVMSAKGFGCLAITREGRLTGMISDGDLRRHMSDSLLRRSAGEIMTPDPITITPEAPASKALALMNGKRITCLLVVDSSRNVVGILHMHDCLRAGIE